MKHKPAVIWILFLFIATLASSQESQQFSAFCDRIFRSLPILSPKETDDVWTKTIADFLKDNQAFLGLSPNSQFALLSGQYNAGFLLYSPQELQACFIFRQDNQTQKHLVGVCPEGRNISQIIWGQGQQITIGTDTLSLSPSDFVQPLILESFPDFTEPDEGILLFSTMLDPQEKFLLFDKTTFSDKSAKIKNSIHKTWMNVPEQFSISPSQIIFYRYKVLLKTFIYQLVQQIDALKSKDKTALIAAPMPAQLAYLSLLAFPQSFSSSQESNTLDAFLAAMGFVFSEIKKPQEESPAIMAINLFLEEGWMKFSLIHKKFEIDFDEIHTALPKKLLQMEKRTNRDGLKEKKGALSQPSLQQILEILGNNSSGRT
jgi:hypothetical protein